MAAVGVQLQCLFGCRLQRQQLQVRAHSAKLQLVGWGLGDCSLAFPARSICPTLRNHPQPIHHLLLACSGSCGFVHSELKQGIVTSFGRANQLGPRCHWKHSAHRQPCFTFSSTASQQQEGMPMMPCLGVACASSSPGPAPPHRICSRDPVLRATLFQLPTAASEALIDRWLPVVFFSAGYGTQYRGMETAFLCVGAG